MSTIEDEVREARGRLRAAAARCLARREAAEQELSQLEPKLGQVRAEAEAVRAAGALERAAEFDAILRELEGRVSAARGERALAAQGHADALAELAALERAEREALVAPLRAAVAPEPLARSAEDVALANVRSHLADVDAGVRLDEELGAAPPGASPVAAGASPAAAGGQPAAAAPSAAAPLSADEQARAELARLKAQRKPSGGGGPG